MPSGRQPHLPGWTIILRVSTLYQFGPFLLDPENGTLLREGESVSATPMVFSLLSLLVENHNRLVQRSDIFEQLWEGVESHSNLDRRISEVRKLLGPELSECLKTVPKKGYRFECAVTESSTEEDAGRKRRRIIAAAAVSVLLLVMLGFALVFWPNKPEARTSVVVLGFRNLSGRAESGWVSTALSEMLAAELEAGRGVRVVPGEIVARTKVELGLEDTESVSEENLSRLYEHLGSDVVVSGSFVDPGEPADQIRVDLRVQDVRSGEVLLVTHQEEERAKLFDLVAVLGIELRSVLGGSDPGELSVEPARAALPEGADAVRSYSEGLDCLRGRDFTNARLAFESVIEADPDFPLAHSALSEVWSTLGYDVRAEREAALAIELATDLPQREQLLVEARYHAMTHDWVRAGEAYGALYRLDPDNLEYALALVDVRLGEGRSDLALEILDQLRELPSPYSQDPRLDLILAKIAQRKGQFDKILEPATRAAERATQLGARHYEAKAYNQIAVARFRSGELEESLEMARKASRIFDQIGDRIGTTTSMRISTTVLLYEGRIGEAVEISKRALAIAQEVGSQSEIAILLGHLATMETRRGRLDLGQAYAQGSIEVAREIGNRRREGISLIYLAGALGMEGRLRDAEDSCQRAAWILSEIGTDKWEAQARSSLAHIMRRQGRINGALEEAEKAVSITRGLGDRVGLAIALDSQAWALWALGRPKEAQASFDELSELGVMTKHRTVVARAHLGTGVLLRTAGDFSGAEKLLRGALENHDEMNEKPQGALVSLELAQTLVAAGTAKPAVTSARDAVERFKHLGIRDGLAHAEAVLAQAYLLVEDLDSAIAAAERARPLLESLENHVATLQAGIALAEVDAARGQREQAFEQLRTLRRQARTLGCVAVAEEVSQSLKRLDSGSSRSRSR